MIGVTHYATGLTEDDVRDIRYLAGSGVRQKEIGRRYGIKQQAVSDIVRRRNWSSVA